MSIATNPPDGAQKRANARAKAALRGENVGACDRVKESLRRGSASKAEIVERTQLSITTVSAALSRLAGSAGGVLVIGPIRKRKYVLSDSPEGRALREGEPSESEFAMATSRETTFKPLNRDPFAHAKLAMATRR